MPVINFKTILEPAITFNPERNDFKLILWAGDVSRVINDRAVTDVERLSDYDVYLCYGYLPGLSENSSYLIERDTKQLSYICVIDINDEHQMNQFIRIFGGKFALIDSDYHGNTPTMPFKYYSQLLTPGATAYHTEGINCLRMPTEELYNALELFAPVLTPELNEKRHWTDEIVEQAKYNDLSPAHTWASPDLKHPYYDGIRERQTKFLNCQKNRNPIFHQARGFDAERFTEYWDQLPTPILTTPLLHISDEMSAVCEGYKATFATYLTRKIQAMGLCDSDATAYIEEGITKTDTHVRHCQKIILWANYKAKVVADAPDLLPSLTYFVDIRKPGSPIREYGVIISKV